jgi:phosphoheptose isomerase
MNDTWVALRLQESAELKRRLAAEQAPAICRAGEALASSLLGGGKVLLFGNGGSAADAQHLAAEFVGRFLRERRPWPALALTTDTSALTAIANDYGFDQVFARQVMALGRPGDVAVGISTSGRSANVLAAIEAARDLGIATIGLTGAGGEELAARVDIPIVVPSSHTPRVQECHLTIGHLLCEMAETLLLAAENGETEAAPWSSGRGPCPPKMTDWKTLLRRREHWRALGKRVVWTNGCFDLLHAGHLHSLRAARAFGDVLVVGVNGDDSVRKLKGPSRPVVPARERAELVSGLDCVDAVIVFEELTPEAALARLQPDVHCKGAEYAPPHGRAVPEARLVQSYGGKVEFLPMVAGLSTTNLVERVRQRLAAEKQL